MSNDNGFIKQEEIVEVEVLPVLGHVDPFGAQIVAGDLSDNTPAVLDTPVFDLDFDDELSVYMEDRDMEDRDVDGFIDDMATDKLLDAVVGAEASKIEKFINYATLDVPQATCNNHEDIAHFIVQLADPTLYMGLLWFKDGDHYVTSGGKSEKHLTLTRYIKSVIGTCSSRYLDEVVRQIMQIASIADDSSTFPIQFANGFLFKGSFTLGHYTKFTPFSIDIEYHPNAQKVQAVENFLDHMSTGDIDFRNLILEMMAHPLITDREIKGGLGKFFMLVGDGANGKGTLLKVLGRIIGSKNSTKLSITNLGDERYINITQGALVNLGDDVQNKPLDEEVMKMIKNYATCDEITMRRLYEGARDVSLLTTLIFTSNHILSSFEKGHSFKRRIVWLPFYNKPKTPIPDLLSQLTTPEALEYWVMLMMEAHDRLYANGKFTESAAVKKFNEDYHQNNNPVTMYLEDVGSDNIIGKTSKQAYSEYESWSEENGFPTQPTGVFRDTVIATFDFNLKSKKVNGRTIRPYQDKNGNIFPQSVLDSMLKAANGPVHNDPHC